jgi:hypothetical protein
VIRLDDDFPDHPKVIGLDDAALALHVRALCYCGHYLTDGYVSKVAIPKLGRPRAVAALVAAGLWEAAAGGGYRIHDYLHYQPSRAEALERREELRAARAAAGRASAEAKRRRAAEPPLPLEATEYGDGAHEERRQRAAEVPTNRQQTGNKPATKDEHAHGQQTPNKIQPLSLSLSLSPSHIDVPNAGAARSAPGLAPIGPRFREALSVLTRPDPRARS